MNLHKPTVNRLAERINAAEIDLEEHGNMVSARCTAAQDKYNAFIKLDTQIINRGAGALAEKLRQGEQPPLAGVPFTLADSICVKDTETTCASRIIASYRPPFSHTAVDKLTEEGALPAGKTNLDEFGLGATGENSYYGAINNPWNTKHTAGSGAAAVVAGGAVPLALEADRNGELRQAASYCGVFGLKPTYGRVSRKGLIGCAPSLEQVGVIAGNTFDLAAALETISGFDPQDPTSADVEVPAYTAILAENPDRARRIKLAVPENWADSPYLQPDAGEDFTAVLGRLNNTSFQVDTVPLPHWAYALITSAIIGAVEAFSSLSNYDGVRFGFRKEGGHLQDMYRLTRTEGFGSALKQYITCGALIAAGKYYDDYFTGAQKMRALIKRELEECLQQYDLIALPTAPFKAPLLGSNHNICPLPDPAAYYTSAANLAGLPALTMPVRQPDKQNGLPAVGLQLIGKAWSEPRLLTAAQLLEPENL